MEYGGLSDINTKNNGLGISMDGRNFCKELMAIHTLRAYEQYVSKGDEGTTKQVSTRRKEPKTGDRVKAGVRD